MVEEAQVQRYGCSGVASRDGPSADASLPETLQLFASSIRAIRGFCKCGTITSWTMATKRPHPSVHPSRHEQVPAEPSRKRRKPNAKAGPGAKSFKKAHPVNELKSRIRSLKRQLERNDSLSAVAQQEKERALRAAQDELERNERATKRNEMIGKWHKVRFFDRRKAEKRLKRAKKELDAAVNDKATKEGLERRVEDAEVDVKYAIFYPLEKEYAPLFPRRKQGNEDDEADGEDGAELERKGDPVMWEAVRRCMAEGTLDAQRNGRLEADRERDEDFESGRKRKKRTTQFSKATKHEVEDAASGAESDEGGAGFWE